MKFVLCIVGGVAVGLVAGAVLAAQTGFPAIGKLATK